MSAPAGYVPYHRSSPYLDLVGPLYEATSDPSRVRIQIDGGVERVLGGLGIVGVVVEQTAIEGGLGAGVAPDRMMDDGGRAMDGGSRSDKPEGKRHGERGFHAG